MAKQLSSCQDEHKKLHQILNFRFPNSLKNIGLFGAIIILIILLASKFIGINTLILKDVLRTLMLLCMLVASLSKDQIEDEYNKLIRYQSYVLAFVITAIYTISIPLIALVFDVLITKITGDGNVNFYEISAFEVIFILMGFQLLFFETLKRFGRAE